MKYEAKQSMELLRRVHTFLVDAKLDGPLAPEAAQVKAAATLAERLAQHGVAQDEAVRQRRQAVDARRQLVDELRQKHMIPIAKQGRVLFSSHPSDPALAKALMVPSASVDTATLVAAARALANTLQQHAARYLAVGFPDDFLTRLRESADRLEGAAADRRGAMQGLAGATAASNDLSSEGRQLVVVLDHLVRDALRNDAERLAAWRSVRRVKKRPKAKEQTPTDGTDTGTTPDATTPVATTTHPEVPMPKAA